MIYLNSALLNVVFLAALMFFLAFGAASLVCFVMVVKQLFKCQKAMIALLCLVLSICGVGLVLALAYGSIQARDWNRKRLMVTYSACIAVTVLSAALCIASGYELLTRAAAMPA